MTMTRTELKNVPGFLSNERRGYCYIECPDIAAFRLLFPKIRNVGTTPSPQDGGMVNEEASNLPWRAGRSTPNFPGLGF